MLLKHAIYRIASVEPLNLPVLRDYIIDQHLKIAENIIDTTRSEIQHAKDAGLSLNSDNTEFDLEAEIKSHPDSLFVKCFAIKADEPNDNGDYFSIEELQKAASTFVGVPVFTNHQNTDINQARGKVIHSWWEPARNGIMIIARVDAEAYPQLARGIKEQYIVGTSMGCQVHHSLCSICHNYAETPDQYCSCIKERKTRLITAKKQKCKFHKNGPKDSTCPLCGSTSEDVQTYDVIDKKAFEHNYGVKFIENSFVVNPACHECGVVEVIDASKLQMKISEIIETLPRLLKAAESSNVMCDNCKCYKIAGQEQLNKLHQAIDLLTTVSTDMLKQKDQIDLEFLSDLVKVLADLQAVTDELNQQGYGKLPSPGESPTPGAPTAETPGTPGAATPSAPTAPPSEAGGAGSSIHSGPAGSVGTVTGPLANLSPKMKKLIKLNHLIPLANNSLKLDSKLASSDHVMLDLKLKIPSNLLS